jgi:2-dehydro-3-deoxygluconokinase
MPTRDADGAAIRAAFDVVTFGETMLRLTTMPGRRLEESSTLDVTIGGAESNVAVAMARLGRDVAWLSALPANALGRRIERELRGHAVDTSHVQWSTEPDARAGVYFLDFGAAPRPTRVLYDRAHSVVASLDPAAVDVAIVTQARLLHLTGITPALSAGCAVICSRLAETAAAAGVPMALDVNYRSMLWSPEEARAGLERLLQSATVVLCGLDDATKLWGLQGEPRAVAQGLLQRSSADVAVVTLAADGACALTRDGRFVCQPALPVHVVDPVGAGDAFAAGFLHAWLDANEDVRAALRTGVALAALKMTAWGDVAIVTPKELDEAIAMLDRPDQVQEQEQVIVR